MYNDLNGEGLFALINVASIYSISKYAIEGITNSLRFEMIPKQLEELGFETKAFECDTYNRESVRKLAVQALV